MELIRPRKIYEEIDKIFPLPFDISTLPRKSFKRRPYPALNLLRFYNLEMSNHKTSQVWFENFPYNKSSLGKVYDFIFEDKKQMAGDVIYTSDWDWKKGGCKMPTTELKDFFINKQEDFFGSMHDFHNDHLFFFFLQEKVITVYLADAVTFDIIIPANLKERVIAQMLKNIIYSVKS